MYSRFRSLLSSSWHLVVVFMIAYGLWFAAPSVGRYGESHAWNWISFILGVIFAFPIVIFAIFMAVLILDKKHEKKFREDVKRADETVFEEEEKSELAKQISMLDSADPLARKAHYEFATIDSKPHTKQ